MAYPVDDNGNIRVDFVWGNMAMQPDEQRGNSYDAAEYTVEGGWATKRLVGNTSLATGWTEVSRRNGDQSDDGNARYDIVEYGAHDIINTGYSNYPAFIENYAGDGDTGLERLVPNIEGLSEEAAYAALSAAGWNETQNLGALYVGANASNDGKVKQITTGLQNADAVIQFKIYTYTVTVPNVVDFDSVAAAEEALILAGLVLGTVTTSTVGATSGNNNWVKSQSPAANATAVIGSAVNLVEYDYVEAPAPSTTGPIAGLNRSNPGDSGWGLNGSDAVMYLLGRTVRPAIGDTITVSGTSSTKWNQTWTVVDVINNDSYNTGGTAVKVTAIDDITFATPDSSSTGGTWTKI